MEISRPCISMESTVAKSSFDCTFDMNVVVKLLEMNKAFGEVRFSERLNMLKTYGDIRLTLSSNGDIIINPIKNKEDAYLLLKRLCLILAPARICSEAGIPIIKCTKVSCNEICWTLLRLKDEKDKPVQR